MAKEPKNKIITKQIIFIVILSVTITTALILWRNNYVANQKTEIQDKVITKVDQYPIDTENDGVYTNDQFGFKLSYPKDIFTFEIPSTNQLNSYGWLKREWYPSRNQNDYFLYLEIGKSYDNQYTYEVAKKLTVNQSLGNRDVNYIHRLKPLNNTISDGVFYYWEIDTSTELKRVIYIYSLSWEKEGTVITINLGSIDKKLLESKYPLFNDVVNSIEIF